MAKETKPETVLERIYTIPLRREYLKVPRWRRTEKAVTATREFLKRHMKTTVVEKVKLGKEVNEALWKHGIKNPPHHIKVTAAKDKEGVVRAELFGVVKKEKRTKEKGKEKKEEVKETMPVAEEKKEGKEKKVEKEVVSE